MLLEELLELVLLPLLPPELLELLVPVRLLLEELLLLLVELGRPLLELELELELVLLGRVTLPESLLPLGRVLPESLLPLGRVLLELVLVLPLSGRTVPLVVVLPLAGRTVVPLLPLLPVLPVSVLGRVVAPPPLLGVGAGVRELMLPAVLDPLLGRTTVASAGLL